ncbi:MAG TPA: hypothetical protein VFC47_00700 [Caulobacteraceae bacterium]|nr:hypothetical protein [Caulobacteraceae bacterium]
MAASALVAIGETNVKIIAYIVGAALLLLGGGWILQGLNVMPGSVMTGHIQWSVYGAVLVVAGLVLIVWTRRRRPL